MEEMDCRLTRDVKGQIAGSEVQPQCTTEHANDSHNVTLFSLFAGNSATYINSVIVNS